LGANVLTARETIGIDNQGGAELEADGLPCERWAKKGCQGKETQQIEGTTP